MEYLRKTPDSCVVAAGWQYPRDAWAIRESLLNEQRGFCAYSEQFVRATDSCDVEHFDPRLKSTDRDSYWNWYTVLHWMNLHKPRDIRPFLPILEPHNPDVAGRIGYENGQFIALRNGDQEAENLIRYLGWNRPELAADRRRHVSRIRDVRGWFGEDIAGFLAFLRERPDCLSFITALRVELGLDVSQLWA
jgi:hypothetical protein